MKLSRQNLFGEKSYDVVEVSENLTLVRHRYLGSATIDCRNAIIDVNKVRMSQGGEEIEDVIGRQESEELPKFGKGCISLPRTSDCEKIREFQPILGFYQEKLFNGVKCIESSDGIATRIDKSVVFISRYDYANLFHTVSDWFNTYIAISKLGLEEFQIVFLDGHCKGNLDQGWTQLFGNTRYFSDLSDGRIQCKRAIFVNAGYSSPLVNGFHFYNWKHSDTETQDMLDGFRRYVFERFDVSPSKGHKSRMIIIDRQDYRAHPRSSGIDTRKIDDISATMDRFQSAYPGHTVSSVRLERLSLKQQLESACDCSVLVGVHGAGNTHTLFLPARGCLVEYFSPGFENRATYRYLAHLCNIHYEHHTVTVPQSPDEPQSISILP